MNITGKIDTISWAAIIYVGIIYFIILPTILYSLYYFHKAKQDELMQSFVQNRSSLILIYFLNIIITFTLCTERCYICVTQIWSFLEPDVPPFTVYLFLSATWITSINLFATKAYYFYYITEYNAFIADKIWVSTINKYIADNFWFIQNKTTFGSINYLLKLNVIPSSICVLIITLISSFYSDNLLVFITLYNILCLIPVLISFAMLYKISKHNKDIYGMKDEITCQSISLLLGIILSFICGVFTAHDSRLFWVIQIYLSLITASALTFTCNFYSMYFYEKQKKLVDDKNKTWSTLIQFKLGDLKTQDQIFIADMEAVIGKYEPFKCFMSYLKSEFATESLAFLAELVQIKYQFQVDNEYLIRVPKQNRIQSVYYLNNERICETKVNSYAQSELGSKSEIGSDVLNDDHINDDMNDDTKYITLDFNVTQRDKNNETVRYTFFFHGNNSNLTKLSVPAKLPESEILRKSNNNDDNNLCHHMLALYHKYIKTGSNYQLNISCQSREALRFFFECEDNGKNTLNYYIQKKEHFQVFNVFDEVALEILWLLQSSFQRFEHSSAFDRKLMYNLRKPENEIYPETRNACSYFKLKETYSNATKRTPKKQMHWSSH